MEAKVITLLNKLPRKDSVTGLDVWYKTKLYNIPYAVHSMTDVYGSTISMGQTVNLLFPFSEDYKPYREWKENPDSGYTVVQGDYIFIDIDLEEDVTPNNLQQIKAKYSPDVCEVRSIFEVPERYGASYQLKVGGV